VVYTGKRVGGFYVLVCFLQNAFRKKDAPNAFLLTLKGKVKDAFLV
jgi:hypothetical protein